MKRTKLAQDIEGAATFVRVIQAQQAANPGYGQDIVASLVNTELRKLERETGIGLDQIADDWMYILAGGVR